MRPQGSFVELLEQATAAGLWCLVPATGELAWSSRMAEMLEAPPGYAPTAAQVLEFVAPPWREEVEALVRRCAQAGESFDREVQALTYTQRRTWVRMLGHAVHGDAGRTRVEGAVLELTPRTAHAPHLLRHAIGWGFSAAGDQAFATIDHEGRFTYLNEPAERLLGQPGRGLFGRGLWSVFQKTVRLRVEEQVRAALERQQALALEELDAGQSDWLAVSGRPFGGGLALHLENVTSRRKSQEQLRLLEGSIARLNDVVIITEAAPFNEPGPRIVFVNDAFELRTGYDRDEVLGRSPRFLQGPQTQRDRLKQVREALEQWRPVRVDLINYRKDGEPFWVDLEISPVWDKSRKLTHWVAVGRDVTERKANEEKIQYLAFYDALTQLPNRQLLLDRLSALLARRRGSPGEGALMFIDLDNFKVLNDTLGHQKGDMLLQQVADRLRASVTSEDTVARLGGDEFVVLLPPRRGAPGQARAHAAAVAGRILTALGEPYVLPGYLHHSTCSIGVTTFGAEPWSVSELLKQADLAMYQAKRAGRNIVCFFDPHMQAVASASAALAADLRQAWREDQFLLEYQPQVDLHGRMTGVEALLRWPHPQRGRVPPEQFIATAEETTLILTIGRWVLDRACEQLARWARRPDRAHLSISVNVSARQFRHPEFVDEVMDAITRAGIAPHKLKLELTETLLADGFDITVGKMGRLRRLGVALSLDDFGTGYSSLAYLKRLPLDQIKIDREFVKDVLTDANDAAIARTIIGLAQSLHLEVVAEGVENEAQRHFLALHGCDSFQGYLYSKPVPIEALEAFIDDTAVAQAS